ncbi:Phospholipase YtpA [Symmachiella dynata]|uniref:bifunctional alpha/beta hydrolase/class I SAM-dependent methyltransferase n=1 Tax=Symmachiella dynata TaxID=2527995 RepID=UPI00118C6A8E|nr:bifunctional alpha/beta hydrolase/class I SAM-dependent methyltransferase [Symmachiella dynata]QDT49416.1 Phospholipase YtpA [Symmachiella dynata]
MATLIAEIENTSTQLPATRIASEHCFTTSDGTELFYRAWAPQGKSSQAVLLFHRGHEHSGRWQDVVDRIGMEETWFFAFDARGHGRSPGERGYAESFGRMVRDADEFVRHLSVTHGIAVADMAVVAQSVGAVLAAAWVHDYAPPIRAMVLATPALRIKLYVPGAIAGLRLLRKVKPKSFIRSYVKPRMLTHDQEQVQEYADDALITPQIATNILLDVHDTSTRLIEDAGAIVAPTLLLSSGADYVVESKPQQQFFDRLGSAVKEREEYPSFYHSTFWEKERDLPIARTREFIERQFEDPAPAASLLEADKSGYSKSICDELERPLSLLSLKRWAYALQKLGMNTGGRLSRGVRIGWRTGFDSGESLDHVYRNRAEGTTFIGRMIDRAYLDSPGWRGIRQRKVHMLELLDRAIARTAQRGEAVRLLDIAAGPGRYVLEAIQRHADVEMSAVLCDRDVGGLDWGRALAKSMGITSVDYRQSDAFDADAIAAQTPRPNIAVVSGLYELFPDNGPIRESLRGLAAAVPAGGLFLYTNQPWHPQQEMIARVLPNRDGDPWVMRCRTQVEMDQLVAAAGFRKLETLVDDEGIFSVSMAVREG